MALIFETSNFTVESHPQPFVSRTDGGHVKIVAKRDIEDRTQFTPQEAIDFIRLSMIVGEALQTAMNRRGIPVVKINYEELGNWSWKRGEKNHMHEQIFGRASNAAKQPFPEAVYLPDRSSGFYDGFEPLNEEDIIEIKKEIEKLIITEKYQTKHWQLGDD